MDHAGGSSSGGGGGASESNWPKSLDKPLTQELYGFGLLVPPGCRLAKPWRICKDGYPTMDNSATPEQLRVHPGGRYNTRGRHDFWDGKNYNDVIRRYRQAAGGAGGIPRRRWAAIPHPPPTAPVVARSRRALANPYTVLAYISPFSQLFLALALVFIRTIYSYSLMLSPSASCKYHSFKVEIITSNWSNLLRARVSSSWSTLLHGNLQRFSSADSQ
ncbi:hypothetical protein ZWY2020_007743 [Hordeum vulgare]|nr:hypothetical protein ZWY2020_007743 [Hordeum vulgare]